MRASSYESESTWYCRRLCSICVSLVIRMYLTRRCYWEGYCGIEFSSSVLKNSRIIEVTKRGLRLPGASAVSGCVDLSIISLKISSISFWKIISSPLRTLLLGANSIRMLLKAVDANVVFALSLLRRCYCRKRISMFDPFISELSSMVWEVDAFPDCTVSFPPFLVFT